MSRQLYKAIVDDIKNSNLSLKEIRNKFNISEVQITNINMGKYCYDGKNLYYKDIYTGDFPIRKNNKQIITDNNYFIPVFYDVLFTKMSITKIGEKHDIKGNTLTYIISGKRRKELTKDFITPLRKNLEQNKKIFTTLYSDYIKEVVK